MIERYTAFEIGAAVLLVWIIISVSRGYSSARKLLVGAFIIYMTLVVAVTIFPIVYEKGITEPSKLELIPFGTTIYFIRGVFEGYASVKYVAMQLVGNILMTIPFGIMLPFFIRKKGKGKYVAAALIFPVSIELLQLVMGLVTQTMYRTTDIDDVMLNFLGVLSGYVIYKILPQPVKKYFHNGIDN